MKIVNFNLGQQTDFLTEQEASTLFDGAGTANNVIAAHLGAANPHGITPDAIGAASEFYAENLAQDAASAAFAHTDSAIASHLAASNPHLITPTLIGAAAANHTHNFNIVKYEIQSGTRITSSINFNVFTNRGYKILALFSHNGRISGATGYACSREFIAAFSSTMGMEIYDLYNLTSVLGGSISISLDTNTMTVTITKVASTQGSNYSGVFSVFVTT